MTYNNGWCETDMTNYYGGGLGSGTLKRVHLGTVNQQPAHHPLDARYYSVLDELQLS